MPTRVVYKTTVADNSTPPIWSTGIIATREDARSLACRTSYPVLVQVEKFVVRDLAWAPLMLAMLRGEKWYESREIILKKHGKHHDLRTHNR